MLLLILTMPINTSSQTFLKDINHTHLFTMFITPDCAFSQIAMPKFIPIEQKFESLKLTVFDCSLNYEFCKSLGVLGYPTFKLYKSNKFIDDFHPTWPRETDVFIEWLELKGVK